jgi:NAD(P)-dependent dehydrogenase (short-subunit alcohol dehydrogenase family)
MASCILVTGASKGIGRAIAEELAGPSTTLLLVGRNEEDLKKVQSQLKGPSRYYVCDLAYPHQIQTLIEELILFFRSGNQLKGLVNNAGIFKPQKSEEARLDLWQTQMQVNLLSAVQITESLLPFLIEAKPSWILNISSSLATRPSRFKGAYGATKAAMNHWTQTLAIELGPHQVRVNAICPGIVDTPIHNFHHLPEDEKQRHIEKLNNLQPLRRIGKPSDIAKAARYLCSEAASWVTGAIFNVDGGVNLL